MILNFTPRIRVNKAYQRVSLSKGGERQLPCIGKRTASPDYNPIEKSWANMKNYLRDHLKEFSSVALAIDWYFFYSNYLC